MNAIGVAAIGIGLYFVAKFSGMFNAGNQLNVVFSSVDMGNSVIHLTAQNTTNTALQLNSLEADVTMNGTDLGNVSMFTPVTIQPNAATDVPLTYSLSILNIIGTGASFLQNGLPTQFNFTVNGTMNVGGISLPLNLTKSFSFATANASS